LKHVQEMKIIKISSHPAFWGFCTIKKNALQV